MLRSLLIANRGEIAIRIARSAADLGVETVCVYAEDDSQSLHTRHGDQALDLGATGVAAYLDGERLSRARAGIRLRGHPSRLWIPERSR